MDKDESGGGGGPAKPLTGEWQVSVPGGTPLVKSSSLEYCSTSAVTVHHDRA